MTRHRAPDPLGRYRAALAAAVSVVLLGGLALTSLPVESAPAARQAAGPARETARTASSPAPAAAAAPSQQANSVAELLRQRSRAVLRGDRQAFLATVDPLADPAFRDAQRELFDNLADVPLREWSYPLDTSTALDPARLRAAGAAADELWAPRTELRYAIRGVDATSTSKPAGYLYARRGPHWYLNSDTALGAAGIETWRGPWDFGPCRILRTDSGLVLTHPDTIGEARRVSAALDEAVDAVDAVWGPRWSRRVAVLVPGGPEEMRALVGKEFAVESIAAVAIAGSSDIRTHTAAGQRVVFNPRGVAQLSDLALKVVLRHEITHVAARAYTMDGAPMWMLEGFADYVGYRNSGLTWAQAAPDLAERVRESGPPARLPTDEDFGAGSANLELAYQQAWSMNEYLAGLLEPDGLVALYRQVAGAGRADGQRLDAMLRTATGKSRTQLIAGWQRYLTEKLG